MIEDEFLAVWRAQAEHYPDLLTEKLCFGEVGRLKYPHKPIPRHDPRRADLSDLEAFGVHGLIFFQRPIYWPKSMIGLCELEPKEPRCARAHRLSERFRLLQELNNIRYVSPEVGEAPLTDEQRLLLSDHLATRQRMTFNQMRKKLDLADDVRFNLERGKRSSIKGMTTDYLIAKKVGKTWHDRADDEKTEIVELLLRPDADEDRLVDCLIDDYSFSKDDADALVAVDLPSGFGRVSLKAIRKLLPHLERGLPYMAQGEEDSAIHAAGYLRPDELERRIFDKLPVPGRLDDCPVGDLPNPVVKRALHQLRKVVNNIIREYGKPDAIHLEMARSVKMGPKKRREYNRRNRRREKQRDEAADELRAHDEKVTGDAILRLLLWKSQDHRCLYCGEPISRAQVLTGGADVDHILPRSRSHDDAQSNKVVCHRHCNTDKGQRTVWEWLGETDPDRYAAVCRRAKDLLSEHQIPYAKYRKILRKHIDSDEFLARQLVDTGYIARVTGEYLRCLFGEGHTVLGLKGQYTGQLRHHWGLNTVLEELPDSPAWEEKGNLRRGEKNRADHRHHALDAIVLALTDRSVIQTLSRVSKSDYGDRFLDQLPDPWDGFRDDVLDKLGEVNVSRQVERGVSGKLHEDTFYGPVYDDDGERVENLFVVRKPLADLSPSEVDKIRDDALRELIQTELGREGIETGRGTKLSADQKKRMKNVLADFHMPSGVPVKTVRVLKKDETIQPIREGRPDEAWVKPGNTHHLCLFEWTEGGKRKRDAVFVTMLEAAHRLKRKEEIIRRTPPTGHPTIPRDARFLLSLSAGEMILANVDDDDKLLVFKTAASTQGQIYFTLHTDARKRSKQKTHCFSANTLPLVPGPKPGQNGKVTVDPLGRIRWAGD